MWQSTTRFEPNAVFSPDYINHQEPLADGGVSSVDLAGWEAIVKANHAAFPDLRVEIFAQLAESDRVATHWRFSATQTGGYEGKTGDGARAAWSGIQIDRFDNGRIAESWVVVWDKFTLFDELGLLN